ncbi:MAG: hypothetical protein SFX72_06915 [Isosphaeraceae bacterium]|nr:hypothetical protein [Isosphaeraceae bacterium]
MSDRFDFPDDRFDAFPFHDPLKQEVEKNEKILWRGKPDPSRGWWMTTPLLLFGIPWTLFTFFWEYMAISAAFEPNTPAPVRIIFPLFGLPFVLIGLGMLSSPWWAARKLRRTDYAITDQRAIIIEPAAWGSGYSVTSLRPDDINSVTKVVRGGGSGDLWLSTPEVYRGRRGSTSVSRKGFVGIPAVGEVERILRSALLEPR